MSLNITLTDYGVGNLYSIHRSLENCGANVTVVKDMKDVLDAECIVFPGVGAFDKTMEKLQPYREDIREKLLSGTPALGICIGMQIMYGSSAEGTTPGLGLFDGDVVPLVGKVIPHMGWNQVVSDDPLMEGVGDNNFYFAHSFRGNRPRTSPSGPPSTRERASRPSSGSPTPTAPSSIPRRAAPPA